MSPSEFKACTEITYATPRGFRTERVVSRSTPQAGTWSVRSFVTASGARVEAVRVLGWLS